MRLPILVAALAVFGLTISIQAQQLKIKEDKGHVSPVRATLTFANGKTRDVVISAIGASAWLNDSYFTHALFVRTEGGVSKRTLWIDQIRAIRGLNTMRTAASEFTIEMKDGSSLDAVFVQEDSNNGCDKLTEIGQSPPNPCSNLIIENADDGKEHINMRDLKSVEFLPPARKDKGENFMFDTWRYSPFTGEKLPNP